MATVNTLLSSHVTILRTWTEGGSNSRRYKCIEATYGVGSGDTLTAGGATNKLLVNAFGLTKAVEVSPGTLDDNSKLLNLAVAADGTFLVNQDVINATDASKNNIADVSVANPRTVRVVVKGY